MNSTRLTPYATNPSPSAPATAPPDAGSVAPRAAASTRLTGPATAPLTAAIHVGSVSATLRVRLLSRPQHRHAPRMASAGSGLPRATPAGALSTTAPAT